MIFGNIEFTEYFIMNPITWIIMILGFPPVMSLWLNKQPKEKSVSHE